MYFEEDIHNELHHSPLRLRGTGSSTIFADGAFLPNTVRGYDLSLSYKVAKGLSNFVVFSTTYRWNLCKVGRKENRKNVKQSTITTCKLILC